MTRTRSSRAAARTETDAKTEAPVPAQEKRKCAKAQPASTVVPQPDAATSPPPRGTKQRLLLDLLQRDGGATLGDLTAATSWLPHTTRAALTRLRQGGYEVTRSRREDGASAYTCTSRAPDGDAQVS